MSLLIFSRDSRKMMKFDSQNAFCESKVLNCESM